MEVLKNCLGNGIHQSTELLLRFVTAIVLPSSVSFSNLPRQIVAAIARSAGDRYDNRSFSLFMGGGEAMQDVKQSRALATRERILLATARLFALKGFHDTKLQEVLSAAKVTTGAFFHHFQNKDDLGFAVIDRHMERRRQQLNKIEESLPSGPDEGMLTPVFRRLDAIAEMVHRRERTKGGCVIGNLSASLSDTHDAFRRRLAECFDQMALEFEPHFRAIIHMRRSSRRMDAMELARYVVTVIEGAILLARTRRDWQLVNSQFEFLKGHLRTCLGS